MTTVYRVHHKDDFEAGPFSSSKAPVPARGLEVTYDHPDIVIDCGFQWDKWPFGLFCGVTDRETLVHWFNSGAWVRELDRYGFIIGVYTVPYDDLYDGWTWNVISKKEARALVDGGANLRPSSPLNGPSL